VDWTSWEVLSPAIIAVSAWIFIALERLFPYDKGQRLFREGWALDFFLYTLLQSYLLGLVIAALIRFVDTHTGFSRLELVTHWPMWAQIIFFLVVHDFYIYWFHRAQHRFPLLWRTHEAHHSVKDVDWLAGSRSHPIEILINQTVEFMPIALLGAPPEMALIKGTIDAVWGMYIHSNINVRAGILQYVVNGPQMHRWHHSAVYTGDGFNYGTKLAIWDWLFGTAHRPSVASPPEKPPAYGLDEPFPKGYVAQIAYAFRPFEETIENHREQQTERAAPHPGIPRR
jgi:sterol desaturase/sphingolipid hydroxylase (fatty acid hydroxylase superfamily)